MKTVAFSVARMLWLIGLAFWMAAPGSVGPVWWIGLPLFMATALVVWPNPPLWTKPSPTPPYDVVALSNQAEQARAHAVKYGLPTAVWDGLGAMWDAIAEQDAETAGKPAETPVQRPTPLKGPGAFSPPPKTVSEAAVREIQRQLNELKSNAPRKTGVMRQLADDLVAREQPWLVQGEVTPGHEQTVADTLTAWSLPKVTATTSPSDKVRIHGMLVSIAPTSTVGRTDLVVRRLLGRASWQFLVVHDVQHDTTDLTKVGRGLHDCQLLARVAMPPNTSTVQQAQITDLRTYHSQPRLLAQRPPTELVVSSVKDAEANEELVSTHDPSTGKRRLYRNDVEERHGDLFRGWLTLNGTAIGENE